MLPYTNAILWSGEEQGSFGARQYVEDHKNETENLDLVLESDSDTFDSLGLEFTGVDAAACILTEVLSLFSGINTTQLVRPMDGGPDLGEWAAQGVPSASLYEHYERDLYYWYHHSPADTMDTQTPQALDKCTAFWATVSFIVADLSVDLPKEFKSQF